MSGSAKCIIPSFCRAQNSTDEALYAARIEDLGPGDFVKVVCIACGHTELLASDMLRLSGCPLPRYTGILDLEPKLRCRECDAKGTAVVSIKWGAQ